MKTLVPMILSICFIGAALTQANEIPKPGPEMQKYVASYCGEYTYSGKTHATPLGPGGEVHGRAIIRPILNGFAIEALYTRKGPEGETESIEISWYDSAAKNFVYTFISNDGYFEQGSFARSGNTVPWNGTLVVEGKRYEQRGADADLSDGMGFIRKQEVSIDGTTWMPVEESKYVKVKASAGDRAMVEQELKRLETKAWNAVVQRDFKIIDRIFSDEFIGIYDNDDDASDPIWTKDFLISVVKSGRYVCNSIEYDDLKVRIDGNAAAVSGITTTKETFDGQDMSGRFRFTSTWIKKPTGWQCIGDRAVRISGTTAISTQCGQVLAFRVVEPKPDIKPKALEKFAVDVYAPTWRKHAPGMKAFLIKGERGKNKGTYIDVWAFDSVQTRNFYFPKEGGDASETGEKILAKAPSLDYEKYFKTSDEEVNYTDYVVLGQGRSIEGSKVIALRPVELKTGVDAEAFEKFAAEVFAPAMDYHAPGIRGFFIKGERGKNKGHYAHVWIFDSIETRDFYFPTEGGTASGLGAEMLSDLPELGWDKYLKESEEDIYTDYIVIE